MPQFSIATVPLFTDIIRTVQLKVAGIATAAGHSSRRRKANVKLVVIQLIAARTENKKKTGACDKKLLSSAWLLRLAYMTARSCS